MADLTATVRAAVSSALRTPGADVADEIIAHIASAECREVGSEIIDLLADIEGFLYGWTDPQAMELLTRVGAMLDRLGVPSIGRVA